MSEDDLNEQTRRAILKGTAATLGVAGVGGIVSGHPGSGDHGEEGHEHPEVDELDVSTVGYHSLGGKGSESLSGDPDEPHYGGISEFRVRGDVAAVGILSSHDPTIDRGVALLDVSGYTRAESRAELDRAEMGVLSFVPNENGGASVMDVKFSDDGEYLFVCKQPVALLFEALAGQQPEVRSEGASSPEMGSLQAVDVSDPGNPEIVGRSEFAFGPHNCYHQRIGGEDYVFAVKGPTGEPAAIYVHRFDRSSGHLQLINYWTHDTQLTQGELEEPTDETAAHGNEYYAHDITVVDDPITGDPYAYLANWNSGARVLDVSDPTNIRELGVFEMERAHTIEPVRRTVDGKRLFVVGQENPGPDEDTGDGEQDREDIASSGGHTGYYYLVDATGVEDDDESTDLGHASADGEATPDDGTATVDGEERGTELAKWVWRLDAEYDNYTYSAHNIDVVDTEIHGQRRLFVTSGHYHAGTRLIEISYPGRKTVRDRDRGNDLSEGGNGSGQRHWDMTEVGWSRTHEAVPDESKFASLSAATPYHWCAVEENGVVFASCISTGVYAMSLDDPALPIGTRVVHEASVDRSDDGTAFTAGQTDHITLSVDTEAEVLVRDRIPSDWSVVGGDVETRSTADGTNVIVGTAAPGETEFDYFVEAPTENDPSNTGSYTFGPVDVSTDGGETWETLADSEESNSVVGLSTSI